MMSVNFIAIVFCYLEVWAIRLRCHKYGFYTQPQWLCNQTGCIILLTPEVENTTQGPDALLRKRNLHKPLVMVWGECILSQDICLWNSWAVLLMAQSPLSLWEGTGCPWWCLLTPVCQQVSLQASQDTSAFGWVKIRQEELRVVSTCGKMFFEVVV